MFFDFGGATALPLLVALAQTAMLSMAALAAILIALAYLVTLAIVILRPRRRVI